MMETAAVIKAGKTLRETKMDNQEFQRQARRAMLLKLAATGALGAGGIAGLVRAALAADSGDVLQGVRYAAGSVLIDGKPVTRGQKLQPGQTVTTGPAADTVFVVGAHAFYQRENSSFTFETSGAATTLRYLSGKILSVFGRGRSTLVTKTATIGIRGTGCYIEAEPERTYFCLCYGSAMVTPMKNAGARKLIRTKHHENPLYIGAADLMKSAPVINHTDDELIMLESMVGRQPPFYGKTDYTY
jgi:hypothetical protein